MVIAASRPVIQLAGDAVEMAARTLPLQPAVAGYFLSLSLVPLLGSFITEPAAMTLAALMLRERIFASGASNRLKYATLGVLFVNVSVGGTLTRSFVFLLILPFVVGAVGLWAELSRRTEK
jgi:hypothetical protein